MFTMIDTTSPEAPSRFKVHLRNESPARPTRPRKLRGERRPGTRATASEFIPRRCLDRWESEGGSLL